MGPGVSNKVQVLGVDGRFWELAQAADRRDLKPGDAVVSLALAERLGIALGESVVLRVEKPSLFSKDAPLSGEEETIESIRVRVVAFADDAHFGRFSLQANQVPPASIFLPSETTPIASGCSGKANLLLSSSLDVDQLRAAVTQNWKLEDASLQLKEVADSGQVELRSSQVFLDPVLGKKIIPRAPSLTYFVNSIRNGETATPYSMVTAVEPGRVGFLPADLADDEMVVSQWFGG